MRRNTKEMLNDMDYVSKLGKPERKWLYKAVSGITNANHDTLTEVANEGKADEMYEDLYHSRDAFRRDLMTNGSRVECGNFSEEEGAVSLPSIREETTVSTFEDALIEAIDSERAGKPNNFRAYGNNDSISVGNDVVICIEGHILQGRIGKVISQRRGQHLIQVQTTKGDVSLYLSTHELARVNAAKKVG